MSSRWGERLRHTLGFRLAAWYAALFVGSSLALAGLTYLLLASSLRERDREIIRSTLIGYVARYEQGGLPALTQALREDQAAGRHEPLFVRVLDSDQEAVFFSLPPGWTDFDLAQLARAAGRGEGQFVTVAGRSGARALEVASALLPDGTLVQVGKSTETREELLSHYRTTLVFALAGFVVFGLAGGAALTRWTMRPIRHLALAVQVIMRTGKVEARVPVAGTADPLDELSALFNRMLDRIESLMAAMRGALDNVAHDLRTPMTRLRATAERALQAEPDAAACREALADCLEEAERVTEMLNTLMDISEAETGAMRLEREAVDAGVLLAEAGELFADVAEDKGVALEVEAPAALVVDADASRLRRAFANLVDNAVKYTPPGGRVACTARADGPEAVVEIRDTGTGIGAGDLPRIWDRLYRGDRSRSERGLGLGLSLVQAIVRAHGGRVDVASTPGEGSTFTVRLPLATAPASMTHM
ncbi:MAG: phoR 2 [Acidobacteria bacterium]|nr:phoR 2 [Acidobacteriota bacterium]